MANLAEIKSAKKLGEWLKKARESQCMSILNLAKLSGLSINQLVNLENGNFFAFGQNIGQFEANVHHCAEKMGVSIISIEKPSEVIALKPMPQSFSAESIEQSIPIFLRHVA
jgi:transcriptional regulator with XRE-family HTH domain